MIRFLVTPHPNPSNPTQSIVSTGQGWARSDSGKEIGKTRTVLYAALDLSWVSQLFDAILLGCWFWTWIIHKNLEWHILALQVDISEWRRNGFSIAFHTNIKWLLELKLSSQKTCEQTGTFVTFTFLSFLALSQLVLDSVLISENEKNWSYPFKSIRQLISGPFVNGLLYASQIIAPKGVYFSCNFLLRSISTLIRIIVKLKSSGRLEKHVLLVPSEYSSPSFSVTKHEKVLQSYFFFWVNFNGLLFLFCWTMKSVIEWWQRESISKSKEVVEFEFVEFQKFDEWTRRDPGGTCGRFVMTMRD